MVQSCHKAHLPGPRQSVMVTGVDLHTVQDHHDKVHGDTRKLPGDQALVGFNFEKRHRGFCAADFRPDCGDEGRCHYANPSAKRQRGSNSDSSFADVLDEAASMASSVSEKDVD